MAGNFHELEGSKNFVENTSVDYMIPWCHQICEWCRQLHVLAQIYTHVCTHNKGFPTPNIYKENFH